MNSIRGYKYTSVDFNVIDYSIYNYILLVQYQNVLF